MGFVILILGLALWFVPHTLKSYAPARRAALAERLGENGAKGVGLLGAVGGVVLMTVGYQQAGWVNVWYPPAWTVHLNNLLMIFAIGIFVASGIPGHVRGWIRHPQLVGFKLWTVSHLLVNGDLASLLLFGGLLGWGVATLVAVNKRDGKGPKPAPTGGLKADAAHAGVTLVAFGAVTWVHNWLGVWPFPA